MCTDNRFDDAGAASVAATFTGHAKLVRLCLYNNCISEGGCKPVEAMMETTTALMHLGVQEEEYGNYEVADVEVHRLLRDAQPLY